jgi:queuosine precursor transporter
MVRVAALAGFLGCIVLSNYLTTRYGFVPVGFGLAATAGTFTAGLALSLRDLVEDTAGRAVVLGAIVAGAALSFLVSDPLIATASAVAFVLSELTDLAVYRPLRRRARFGQRRWALAVAGSNLAGALVDTAVFLGVAFGVAAIVPALPGQLLGKAWGTLVYLGVGVVIARALLRQPEHARRA